MPVIYQLYDKRDGAVFYIGTTKKTPEARLAQHRINATNGRTRNMHFVRRTAGMGFDNVGIGVIETVSNEEQFGREKYWIEKYLAAGVKLVNLVHNGIAALYSQADRYSLTKENIEWIREWHEMYLCGYEIEAEMPRNQELVTLAQARLHQIVSLNPEWLSGISS